jgi:hypothetical protein
LALPLPQRDFSVTKAILLTPRFGEVADRTNSAPAVLTASQPATFNLQLATIPVLGNIWEDSARQNAKTLLKISANLFCNFLRWC